MLTEDKLWLPPLSPRDQKRLLSFRRKKWKWSGLSWKTLWDWLRLLGVLAIPLVLALGTLWSPFTTRRPLRLGHDLPFPVDAEQRE